MPRIVCISDTHGFHDRVVVPLSDIFLHSGDFGRFGSIEELKIFKDWLLAQPRRYKVFVADNHDWCFQKEPQVARELMKDVIYLQDSSPEIPG